MREQEEARQVLQRRKDYMKAIELQRRALKLGHKTVKPLHPNRLLEVVKKDEERVKPPNYLQQMRA